MSGPLEVFEELPEGWAILEAAATAPEGYKWIWNKMSRFGGNFRHALLKCREPIPLTLEEREEAEPDATARTRKGYLYM